MEVSLKTIRRSIALLPTAVREGLLGGTRAMRAKQLYLSLPAGARHDRWQLDHTQLQALVRFGRKDELVQPWLTTFIDESTRFCVGWTLTVTTTGAADTDSIMATLAEAIARYGKPKAVRIDQGADYLSDSLQLALDRLGIDADPCPAGEPFKKGKVERSIGTLKRAILPSMPGYWARARKDA